MKELKNENEISLAGYHDKLPIIPVREFSKAPSIKWKDLHDKEPLSYRKINKNENIALLTGNTIYFNFVAFDFDTHGDMNATNTAANKLCSIFGDIPWGTAYIQKSPNNGMHAIFRAPKGILIPSRVNVLEDNDLAVDIRSEKGIILLAPSKVRTSDTHEVGFYEANPSPDAVVLSNAGWLPESVCQRLISQNNQIQQRESLQPTSVSLPMTRHDLNGSTMIAKFTDRFTKRCLSNLASAETGTRNNELNRQSFKLGQLVGAGLLNMEVATSMLSSNGMAIGLDRVEVIATVQSGLNAGLKSPILVPIGPSLEDGSWLEEHQIESKWSQPKPLCSSLSPVETIDDSMLPEDLYTYANYKARRLDDAPIDFIVVSTLVAFSAAVGTSYDIRVKRASYDWKETPVLWGMLVAPPSAKKTPTLNVGLSFLRKAQQKLEVAHANESKAAERGRKAAEKKAKFKEEEAFQLLKDNPDAGEEVDKLLLEADTIRESIKTPRLRELYINDATPEAIVDILTSTNFGVLAIRDELAGLFKDFNDPKSNCRTLFLEGFGGQNPYKVERVGRGQIRVKRLAIWMLGGIQPDRLAPILKGRASGGDNDGLLERMQLMVMPDLSSSQYHDEPVFEREKELGESIQQKFYDAVDCGHDENGHSRTVVFHPLAQDHFEEWLTALYRRIEMTTPDRQALLGKQPGICARLALIFHLWQGRTHEDPVLKESLDYAIRFLAYLESHQVRITHSLVQTIRNDTAIKLLGKIKDGLLTNPFSSGDVTNKRWAGIVGDARDQALKDLCDGGYLICIQTPNPKGRPTKLYFIHPEYC